MHDERRALASLALLSAGMALTVLVPIGVSDVAATNHPPLLAVGGLFKEKRKICLPRVYL